EGRQEKSKIFFAFLAGLAVSYGVTMIIQTSLEGKPNFVIEQPDHTRTCGQLARAFGNENFSQPTPHDLVIYIVEHHDEGWASIDALREQSPTTGLPHHLTQTPIQYLIQTSKGSPE